jgi:hypothetical protein
VKILVEPSGPVRLLTERIGALSESLIVSAAVIFPPTGVVPAADRMRLTVSEFSKKSLLQMGTSAVPTPLLPMPTSRLVCVM